MAIGIGEGSEVWAPLGRVVLGGLFVSMLFTLFFIPSLYSVIEEFRERHLAHPVLEVEAEATEAGVAD
jgi:HAE1 family hydrophobic/amphiphilic exporter-1